LIFHLSTLPIACEPQCKLSSKGDNCA